MQVLHETRLELWPTGIDDTGWAVTAKGRQRSPAGSMR